MTKKLYLVAPQQLEGAAKVTALETDPVPVIRLDATLFHPQGGGQRGDRGQIGPVRVLDTRHGVDGEIDHFVDSIAGLEVDTNVDLAVDNAHRRRGARLHS